MTNPKTLPALRLSGAAMAALMMAATTPAMAEEASVETVLTDPANFEVTKFSAGGIMLGTTIADARIAAPDLSFARGGGPENSIVVDVIKDDVLLMVLYTEEDIEYDAEGNAPPIDEAAVIVAIDILDPRYRTNHGVHVGMSAEDAERAMGKLKSMVNFPHEGEVPSFYAQPDYLRFTARMRDGSEDYTAGVYEEIPDCEENYPPLCQVARGFNPGAEIGSMAIGLSANLPKSIIEITDLRAGFRIIREGPAGEQCSGEEPITTYNVWSKTAGPTWFQPIEIAGAGPCIDGFTPFERITYDDQAFVYLDDFNFDGQIDLALHNGNYGGYGSNSYNVYFFDEPSASYMLDEAFTELTYSLGMFEVDAAERMLYVHSKSGCCWHQRSGYTVVDGQPIKVYEETVEFTDEEQGKTTIKRLVEGEWVTLSETIEPIESELVEPEVSSSR